MNGCKLRFDLTGAHAEVATLPTPAVKKRSRKANHMFAATVLACICVDQDASLRFSRAICRYASRNSW